MRITVMGAGGVGAYFGGRLAEGGCTVGFVARGPHLAALRERGLVVESQRGDIRLPTVRASDNPGDLGCPDFVLICVPQTGGLAWHNNALNPASKDLLIADCHHHRCKQGRIS